MAVTDMKNRDTNGFSKQKIPNLAHTGEKHISRPPPATTSERLGSGPRRVAMPFIYGQRSSWHKCSMPQLRLLYELTTYICTPRYHTILYDAHT